VGDEVDRLGRTHPRAQDPVVEFNAIEVGVERLESLDSCSASPEPTPLVGITLTQRVKSRLLGPTESECFDHLIVDVGAEVAEERGSYHSR